MGIEESTRVTDYTKKGHRLEHLNGLLFQCNSRYVIWNDPAYQKGSGLVLAQMLIFAPCTAGHVAATLRAWLSVYNDDELLTQVEGLVDVAIGTMKDVPPPSESAPKPQPDLNYPAGNRPPTGAFRRVPGRGTVRRWPVAVQGARRAKAGGSPPAKGGPLWPATGAGPFAFTLRCNFSPCRAG